MLHQGDSVDLNQDAYTVRPTERRDAWYKWAWQWRSYFIIVLTPIIFCPLILVDGLPQPEMKAAYAIIILAVYWVLEVAPLSVTAFLPMILFPCLGVMDANQTSMPYFKETNTLFLGGLIVAVAIEHVNLHKRVALRIILLVGVQPRRLMLGFMVTTAFLSMWISNTATTAMMLPIAVAVLEEISADRIKNQDRGFTNDDDDKVTYTPNGTEDVQLNIPSSKEQERMDHEVGTAETKEMLSSTESLQMDRSSLLMSKGLVMGVAYAANIGGAGTLIGTGPNIVFQGQVESLFPQSEGVGFAEWIFFAFPITVALTLVAWLWLQSQYIGCSLRCLLCLCYKCKKRQEQNDQETKVAREVIEREYKALGPLRFAEKVVLVHFIILVILWLTRHPMFVPGWDTAFKPKFVKDSQAAIFVAVFLFIAPSEMPSFSGIKARRPPPPILTWEAMSSKFPWNIIILLGSGFAMAEACKVSGLSKLLGLQLEKLHFIPTWALVLLCSTLITGFTEVTSNTATASIFLPILAELAKSIGVHPYYLMLPATISASFAFMLPVATPPNAIVFSSGYLRIPDMAKTGIIMNAISILVLFMFITTYGAWLFDLNGPLPDWVGVEITNATTT